MIKYFNYIWSMVIDFYYAIWRFFKLNVFYWPKEIYWFIQRGKNGFAENDVWGFDQYLAKVIFGGMKQLQKNMQGAPTGLSEKQWNKILNEIQLGFNEYLNQYNYIQEIVDKIWPDEITEDKKKIAKYRQEMYKLHKQINKNLSRSFYLLETYFQNLWD